MVSQRFQRERKKRKRSTREKWKLFRKLDCLHEGKGSTTCSLAAGNVQTFNKIYRKMSTKKHYVEMWLHSRCVALQEMYQHHNRNHNQNQIECSNEDGFCGGKTNRFSLIWFIFTQLLLLALSNWDDCRRTKPKIYGACRKRRIRRRNQQTNKKKQTRKKLIHSPIPVLLSHEMNIEHFTPSCEITSTVTEYVPILIRGCIRPPVGWSLVCCTNALRIYLYIKNCEWVWNGCMWLGTCSFSRL